MTSVPQRIAAFGDSITAAIEVPLEERWVSLLEAALPGSTVFNCGVGGNTSREGLVRLDEVIALHPDTVLVEFGGNDTTWEIDRHVPIEEFTRNLEAIVARLAAAGAASVIVTFPPVIDAWNIHSSQPIYLDNGGCDKVVERYRETARRFAVEHRLKLVDLGEALRNGATTQPATYFQPDGVHLTAEGNRIVMEAMRRELS